MPSMVSLPQSNRALRKALNVAGLTPEAHRQTVETLRELYPHTIRFLGSRRDETCVLYALNLTDDLTYRSIARTWDVFAGREFMTSVDGKLKEADRAREGHLISYYRDREWRHIGVITGAGRVTSKWGTYPCYEHAPAEVTEEYGDEVRFFERPSAKEALALFLGFARESGLSESDIAAALTQWRG